MHRNKTFIGAFVFGSIILICCAFFLLGYGKFTQKQVSFVLFFDSSLRGLTIDSPVYFKGVPVGAVRSIYIVPNSTGESFKTAVIIELNGDYGKKDEKQDDHTFLDFMDNDEYVYGLIEDGLRAKLSTASLITGQLVVELAMVARPAPLTEWQKKKFRGHIQIPTSQNVFDLFLTSVGEIPIKDITSQLVELLHNLNTTLVEMNLPELSANINIAAKEMKTLGENSKLVIEEYRKLGQILNKNAGTIIKNIQTVTANGAKLTQEDSALMQELYVTLQALRDAANSISYLAKLLEKQPDALIFGKAQ